ncbi:hypothetical protein C1645_785217 [Glomus cerebriforme]|uniref:TLDc domain-containing protein n=1 Tax=Glomus cerebriforme TaxID=658196 RepID=A0A397SMU7_9GLOM|nr:hypothetical protein C1645_785217 [Glomus cerebriforme]
MLVLVKCQNSRKIFGGYTPVGFYRNISKNRRTNNRATIRSSRNSRNRRAIISSSIAISSSRECIYSEDSFIFSFAKNDDVQNMKLSRVTSYNYAVYNLFNSDYMGFNFGDQLYMQDQKLFIDNDDKVYEFSINDNHVFTIEEIEAFRIFI